MAQRRKLPIASDFIRIVDEIPLSPKAAYPAPSREAKGTAGDATKGVGEGGVSTMEAKQAQA